MRVSLHPSLLQDPSSFDDLDELARMLQSGRHLWVFDEADLEAIESSEWLTTEPESRAGRRHRELFVKTAKAVIEGRGAVPRDPDGSDPPARAHSLRLVVGGTDGLPLGEGLAQLECPAELLVEDDISDGRFIRCLIKAFTRDALGQALEEGWLVITHCGGKGGIAPRATRQLSSSGARADRILALLDSDREYPGHRSSSVDIAKKIEAEGIGVILLFKREAENYLPLAALAMARQKSAYRAYRDRLTPAQQDHFDMKRGFKSVEYRDARGRIRERTELSDSERRLYEKLPQPVRRSLAGGFGSRCGELFDHPEVTREGLEARSRHHGQESELLGIMLALETMI